jgi:hypothetical protein
MNTDWKNEGKVNQAEKAVVGSIDKLESAMESLTDKVEDSSARLQHVVDLGVRQKDELLRIKSMAQESIFPIFRDSFATGRQLYINVKADPRPYLYGAAIIVGGLILLNFRSKRRGGYRSNYMEGQENWAA